MNFEVKFNENSQSFKPGFGAVISLSDSGYEKGYAAGKTAGIAEKEFYEDEILSTCNNALESKEVDTAATLDELSWRIGETYGKGFENGDSAGYARGNSDGYNKGVAEKKLYEEGILSSFNAQTERHGVSAANSLDELPSTVDSIFYAGEIYREQQEYGWFWDNYQYNGTRSGYSYAFAGVGWTDAIFKPKHNIVPSTALRMFCETGIKNLKQCLESSGATLDLSKVKNAQYLFYNSSITVMPKLNLSAMTNSANLFQGSSKLTTIDELEISETVAFVSTSFNGCTALAHMIMTGTLATNGLDLHWSTGLDRESLLSIINVLQDKTAVGGTWTVTLGNANLARLTDAEKAVATQKGWTLL